MFLSDSPYAIDYILTLPFVDANRIGAPGIRAGGGAAMQASCLDRRIRAVAGISIFDVGGSTRSMGKEKPLEFVDYYRTPRAFHPRSANRAVFSLLDRRVSFFPFQMLNELMTQPLLFISGEISDAIEYSKEAYEAACGPKELYLVKGAGHMDMYDREPYVSEAVVKLASFFADNLK